MRNSSQYLWSGAANRCAICEGKFGLVRHYCWRTAFCSRKCADRFQARRADDPQLVAPAAGCLTTFFASFAPGGAT